MALFPCPECGKQVSDKAKSCPHCGCPVTAPLGCEDCGQPLVPKSVACGACGCPVSPQKTMPLPRAAPAAGPSIAAAPPGQARAPVPPLYNTSASPLPTQEELVAAGIRARRSFWGPWWALLLSVVWFVAGSQIFKGALDQYRLAEAFHRSEEFDEIILFGIAWACFVLPIGLWRAANHKWG